MAYEFAFSTPDNHIITRYIRYASMRTDASWDFHEAGALWILSVISKRIRYQHIFYSDGLPTNLYIMLIGTSTVSRKSTILGFPSKIIQEAIPVCMLSEKMSPEALVEQMALKGDEPAAWGPDEFSFLFKSMTHKAYMKDFSEILLRIYDGNDYEVARHSKRIKGGEKEEDKEILVKPHLCIMAPTTPAVFAHLTYEHLESGLLPRFAVVMPPDKDIRKPFYAHTPEIKAAAEALKEELINWVKDLYAFLNRSPEIRFTQEALIAQDEFALEVEKESEAGADSPGSYMKRRLDAMLLKLSMLIAIGNPAVYSMTEAITVKETDVRCAMKIMRKWKGYAETFAERIAESEFEGKVQRGIKMLAAQKIVRRDKFARHVKVPNFQLQGILDTIVTRGYADVSAGMGRHPVIRYVNGTPQDMSEVPHETV